MDDIKNFCRHYALPWRMFMEIEARQNNIIRSPEETLMHDLRERAWIAAHATWFALAQETMFLVELGTVFGLLAFYFMRFVIKVGGQPMATLCLPFAAICIIIWFLHPIHAPIAMALNMVTIYVRQKEVKACVLEAELSISEMPFAWRCMFYGAFEPKVAKMLWKATAKEQGEGRSSSFGKHHTGSK